MKVPIQSIFFHPILHTIRPAAGADRGAGAAPRTPGPRVWYVILFQVDPSPLEVPGFFCFAQNQFFCRILILFTIIFSLVNCFFFRQHFSIQISSDCGQCDAGISAGRCPHTNHHTSRARISSYQCQSLPICTPLQVNQQRGFFRICGFVQKVVAVARNNPLPPPPPPPFPPLRGHRLPRGAAGAAPLP